MFGYGDRDETIQQEQQSQPLVAPREAEVEALNEADLDQQGTAREDDSNDGYPVANDSHDELIKELESLRNEINIEKSLSKELKAALATSKQEKQTLLATQESLQSQNMALLKELKEERDKCNDQATELQTLHNTMHNMEKLNISGNEGKHLNLKPSPSPAPRKAKSIESMTEEGDVTSNAMIAEVTVDTEDNDKHTELDDDKTADNAEEKSDEQSDTGILEGVTDPAKEIDMLLIQIRVLNQENDSLREVIKNLRYKYDQAIAALKEVEESFQQRDLMVEHYKLELERIANNESRTQSADGHDTVELRNGLLDTRLQLERLKNMQEAKANQEAEINGKLEPIVLSLHESQRECAELRLKVERLETELDRIRPCEQDKRQLVDELSNVKIALQNSEIVTKNLEQLLESEKKTRKVFEMENELIVPLKEQVTALERDLEAVATKAKVKSTKYKYMKKELERYLNELNEMKMSTECMPVMQREIDTLAVKNEELTNQLDTIHKHEAERLSNETEQKRKEEEQRKLEKEAWEKRLVLNNERLYEIVNHRNGDKNKVEMIEELERPRSAPHPKVISSHEGRRLTQSNPKRGSFPKRSSPPSSLINPEYINSYPDAIRATGRIHRRQQANLNGIRKLKRDRTKPLTTKHPPTSGLPSPGRDPKVLLYDRHGEREGKRLLAKGDVVMINTSLPSENGEKIGSHLFDVSGVVHYIGPRSEDDQQIYIGIILDEPVGDHDGKVDGRRYFKCEAPYGKLVKLTDVISILKHGVVEMVS